MKRRHECSGPELRWAGEAAEWRQGAQRRSWSYPGLERGVGGRGEESRRRPEEGGSAAEVESW